MSSKFQVHFAGFFDPEDRADNHSPAERLYEQMRRAGTCVTSPLFQTRGSVNSVPVLVDAQPAQTSLGGAVIPPPKDPSMPDG